MRLMQGGCCLAGHCGSSADWHVMLPRGFRQPAWVPISLYCEVELPERRADKQKRYFVFRTVGRWHWVAILMSPLIFTRRSLDAY